MPSLSPSAPPVPLPLVRLPPTPAPAEADALTLPPVGPLLGQGSPVAVGEAVGEDGEVGAEELGEFVSVIGGMMPDELVRVVVVVVTLVLVEVDVLEGHGTLLVEVDVEVVVVAAVVPWLTPAGANDSRTTTSNAPVEAASARRVCVFCFMMFPSRRGPDATKGMSSKPRNPTNVPSKCQDVQRTLPGAAV
jgi:hypothetical protein